MSETLRIGVAQMSSGQDVRSNLDWMTCTIEAMGGAGVELACFPENATQLAPEAVRIASAESLEGAQLSELRAAAARSGVAVLVGSFAERSAVPGKTYNTSVLIEASGEIAAVYRKIHLFDVAVSEDTRFQESASVEPGEPHPVVASVCGWRVGMSICYDVRFPELYRELVREGAEVLAVPAAFTYRTGSAHWHVLLRARAVENLSYVVAPAQVGRHYGDRESYGHALVVGPWGDVLAEVEGGVGWSAATLRRGYLASVRASLPSLSHRRL